MFEFPKISIVTPSYNQADYLEETILSVINQNYPNLEYIIIDGGSEDNTVVKINEYKDRISHFISEKDNGLYDAMNKGIKMATGEVIGILNSDDLYQDFDVINDVMKQFNNDIDLDILYGNLVYVKTDDINRIVRKWKCKPYYNHFFENGKIHKIVPILDWKKEGIAKLYYENGNLKFLTEYKNDVIEGIVKGYHENGKLYYSGKVKDNIKEKGFEFEYYDEEGNLVKTE